MVDAGMSAGGKKCHKRKRRRIWFQKHGIDMTFKVIDADPGNFQGK